MPDQYDQDPMNLRKEDPNSFDDHYSIEKTPGSKDKWRAQVYLTFAPHDSEQYKKTMEKDQQVCVIINSQLLQIILYL
jgi:ribosome-binding factor A